MTIEWQVLDPVTGDIIQEPPEYDAATPGWQRYTFHNPSSAITAVNVGMYLDEASLNVEEDTIAYPSTMGLVVDWYDMQLMNANDPNEGLFIAYEDPGSFDPSNGAWPTHPTITVSPMNLLQGIVGNPILYDQSISLVGTHAVDAGSGLGVWIYINVPSSISARRLYFSLKLRYDDQVAP